LSQIEHRSLSLGEVLDGDRMAKSLYKIRFKENLDRTNLCRLQLDAKEVEQLKEAVEDAYYFEFVVDDLPVRNFIGHLLEEGLLLPHRHKTLLWTHYHFAFEYNGQQIIKANVSVRDGVDLTALTAADLPLELTPTYSVGWSATETSYDERLDRSKAAKFFPVSLEIHWLSVINSMVLALLLVGFVAVILTRILRSDFARYAATAAAGPSGDAGDEYGWKIVHADVFRFPRRKMLFCAVLGVGTQLVAVAALLIVVALTGLVNVHRHGAVDAVSCLLYALTSFVGGFVSSRLYKQMGEGFRWVRCVHATACLFAVPFLAVWSVQNGLAWLYNSTQVSLSRRDLVYSVVDLMSKRCQWPRAFYFCLGEEY